MIPIDQYLQPGTKILANSEYFVFDDWGYDVSVGRTCTPGSFTCNIHRSSITAVLSPPATEPIDTVPIVPKLHTGTPAPAKTADITLQANIDLEPDVARVSLPRVNVTGVLHLPEEVKAPHPFLSKYQIPLFTVSDTALSAIRVALVNGINHANDLLEVWEKHGGSSTRMTTRLLETLNKEIEQMEAARDTLDSVMYGKEQPTVEE